MMKRNRRKIKKKNASCKSHVALLFLMQYTPIMRSRFCNNRMLERLFKYVVVKLTPPDPVW